MVSSRTCMQLAVHFTAKLAVGSCYPVCACTARLCAWSCQFVCVLVAKIDLFTALLFEKNLLSVLCYSLVKFILNTSEVVFYVQQVVQMEQFMLVLFRLALEYCFTVFRASLLWIMQHAAAWQVSASVTCSAVIAVHAAVL